MSCGCITEAADDIEVGVVFLVSQCEEHRAQSESFESKMRPGLDWELDQMVSATAKGKRCDRIWKEGPP